MIIMFRHHLYDFVMYGNSQFSDTLNTDFFLVLLMAVDG